MFFVCLLFRDNEIITKGGEFETRYARNRRQILHSEETSARGLGELQRPTTSALVDDPIFLCLVPFQLLETFTNDSDLLSRFLSILGITSVGVPFRND